ncbi:MAG: deoxyribodipyrimidine photolyase [Actinobacteria bacterium]|nr:deoxyribodipyrimidine photolyase [Actinomycetota bacterium]|tara:strand:- start:5990 stop:7345 length:1356 start_codon:yes stop_codon:yes gene_type:complete
MTTALFWFRKDLRLKDNLAWTKACEAHRIHPVLVLEPELISNAGSYRRRQFFLNVSALAAEIKSIGGELSVIRGPAKDVLPRYIRENNIDCIYFNEDTTPFSRQRDDQLLKESSVPINTYWSGLVHPPETVLTQKNEISKVFTPFYKKWVTLPAPPSIEDSQPIFVEVQQNARDETQDLIPSDSNEGYKAAADRFERFLKVVDDYQESRNFPSEDGTSFLSSDLHFGTIGPREILHRLSPNREGHRQFIRQLAWRDWYAHLLFANQDIPSKAANPSYDSITWRDDPAEFENWRKGQTGYPIVDAGMRQLSATGWMHNRVRMITASFLVKHLLVDWRKGEKYFRKMLIDGDVAQNCGNWQWVAGTGFDAAPYFRVFNPVLQSKKFDPMGRYIRRWVSEIEGLSNAAIHAPWEHDQATLQKCDVKLGETYPFPMVNHADARERAIDTYKEARG